MGTKMTDRAFSDLPVPPGELLAEELEVRSMSQKELADRTGRPEQTISEIVNGKKSITHDTALELEKVLGIAASFWVNLESSFQLTKARLRELHDLEKQEDWLGFFPVKELEARGCIPRMPTNREKLMELLKFFGAASFVALRQRQESILGADAVLGYRITPKSMVNQGALWAWLRAGELEAEEMELGRYDEARFLSALSEIRSLTRESGWKAIREKMTELCAAAGVSLVIVKEFEKSGASGVARWLSADHAMIQLSTKRRFVDMFWFSLFHEAKHVLERQRKRTFVNGINDDPTAEKDADEFASNLLIPEKDWRRFVATAPRSHDEVRNFALEMGIHPEIVVGRLHHEGVLPPSHLNGLRRRFQWTETR